MTSKPGTSVTLKTIYLVFLVAFLLFLFVPLIINGILAFNNDEVPSFPWRGATLAKAYYFQRGGIVGSGMDRSVGTP